MEQYDTNLFCLIGKPGTGKSAVLETLLSNVPLVNDYGLRRFVHGTTKQLGPDDINDTTYQFYTVNEYRNINPNQIIESRSYDDIYTGEIDYYFTLVEQIELGKNLIGVTTLFQYEEIKKWMTIQQMTYPASKICIYPIYIQSPLHSRISRLLRESGSTEDIKIYNLCANIISERYEYRESNENTIIDKANPDTCIVNNMDGEENLDRVCDTIEKFIMSHIDKVSR